MVYGREKTVAIFHDIPGGHYDLQTSMDGYEYLITEDMILSTEYLQGDVNDNEAYWGRSIYMIKNDATRVFPYYIKVTDSKGKKVNDLTCSLVYEDKNRIIGDYEISDGRIRLTFMAHKGSVIGVVVNDNYYEVEFNDVNEAPVIVINR